MGSQTNEECLKGHASATCADTTLRCLTTLCFNMHHLYIGMYDIMHHLHISVLLAEAIHVLLVQAHTRS